MPSLKGIWTDPVWSKVIAAAILGGAGAAISFFFNLWPAIGAATINAFGFLRASTAVQNWLIGLGFIAILFVVCVFVVIGWQIAFPPSKAVTKSWHSYVKDNFFGLRWHWRYGASGDIYDLYCCCEACDYQVHPEMVSAYIAIPRIAFRCDGCGRTVGPYEMESAELESKVRRFIQQKLRTGSWADAVS